MSARMIMATMPLFAYEMPPHANEPVVMGVCAQIARALRLPVSHVRVVVAVAIAASLVIPGLLVYGALGLTFRSRCRFAGSRPRNPSLARANSVLEAYMEERR